jgi:hypothetical protein
MTTATRLLTAFISLFLLALVSMSVGCGGVGSPTSTTSTKTLTSVSVTPATANISAGATQQFTATANYSDGSTANVTSSATWAAATQSVATVNTGGLAQGVAAGSTKVTATVSGMSGSAMLTVAPTLSSIAVTPTNPSIAAGATQQFTATSTYSDGSTRNVSSTATWTTTTASVATISSSGLATAVATGSSVITAAVGSISGTTTLTVPPQVTSIAIAPATAGTYTGDTDQFTATATYSNGSTANVTSTVSWTSTNTSVATISTSGLATGLAAGTSAVTASLGGVTSAAVTLTVQAKTVTSITVTPSTASTYTTDTAQFSAMATYNDGSTASVTSTATWTTTPSSVASVNSSGLATGVAAGSTTVTAAVGTITGTAALTVQTKALTSITVAPTNPNVAEDGTLQFGATGTYNDGSTGNATSSVTWSASAGTITTAGLYTAPSSSGAETVTATSPSNSSITANAKVTVANAPQGAVLTYHNDDARDGAYTQEVTLMPSNVSSTMFGKLYAYPVDGQIYAQPLYMPQMTIGGGTHDVVFVVTQNDTVYAFNADATSSQTAQTFWTVHLGSPVNANDPGGPAPNVGILSTPVIDPSTNTMYLVAEESGTSNVSPFYLYALDIATGEEKIPHVNVTGSVAGTGGDSSNGSITLEPSCYQRMGLALNPVTNAIYMAFGSCTHGWVLAYDKNNLQQIAIFNDTPDGDGGGLWASGGAPAIDDTTGNLYLMSGVDELVAGNPGTGDPVNTGYNDSFLELDPNDLSVLSFFTPDNNFTLAEWDADLGSGSNILLPNSTLTVGGGKDGNVFVVNRTNMGGYNPPPVNVNDVVETVQICTDGYNNIFSTPVYWNGSIYYHCNSNVLLAFSWNPSNTTTPLSTIPTSKGTFVYQTNHGATPSLSANGTNNGIIWDIDNSNYVSSGLGTLPLVLHAYDATNVAAELYNSSQAANNRDTAGAALKFTVPTIAGGKVFVPTATELDIYGLLP